MRFAAVNLEFPINRTAKTIVRNHSANRAFDQQFRMSRATRLHVFGFVSADVAGKAHEALLLLFLARDPDLVGVNHDDEIAGIDVGREKSLFLSAQKVRRLHRDPTQDLIFGIDQPPFAVNFVGFRGKRLHWRLEKGTEATGHEVGCQPMESGAIRGTKGAF